MLRFRTRGTSDTALALAQCTRVIGVSALLLLTEHSVGSKVEDDVHPDRQRVWDGLVAAGVDEVLEARLNEQAGFDGAAVSPLQGHLPALHADGGVGHGLKLLRAAQVAAVRAVSQP